MHKGRRLHAWQGPVRKLKGIIPSSSSKCPYRPPWKQDPGAPDGARASLDVLAKCYGGDITRKRKLLEKQKAGRSA